MRDALRVILLASCAASVGTSIGWVRVGGTAVAYAILCLSLAGLFAAIVLDADADEKSSGK